MARYSLPPRPVKEESLEKWHHDVFAGVCVKFLTGNLLSDLEISELIVSLQDEQARDAFIFAFGQEEVTATVKRFCTFGSSNAV